MNKTVEDWRRTIYGTAQLKFKTDDFEAFYKEIQKAPKKNKALTKEVRTFKNKADKFLKKIEKEGQ